MLSTTNHVPWSISYSNIFRDNSLIHRTKPVNDFFIHISLLWAEHLLLQLTIGGKSEPRIFTLTNSTKCFCLSAMIWISTMTQPILWLHSFSQHANGELLIYYLRPHVHKTQNYALIVPVNVYRVLKKEGTEKTRIKGKVKPTCQCPQKCPLRPQLRSQSFILAKNMKRFASR